MGPIGYQEMVLIFIVALLLFGPKKLPEIGRTVAKAIGEFRKASNELKDTWQREMSNIDRETSDVRADIHKEVQKITDEANSYVQPYSESYYGSTSDSNYDYGAYGYPDSTTTTTEAAAATGAVTGEAAATDAAATETAPVETASNTVGEPVSTIETAPSVTPASGTVSTGGAELTASVTPAPAEPAAPAPSETPKA